MSITGRIEINYKGEALVWVDVTPLWRKFLNLIPLCGVVDIHTLKPIEEF